MSKTSTSAKTHPHSLAARRRALGALVERERPGVVARLGKKMTHVDAEELFQEACLRALERLPQQQHPAQLRAWFNTVLRTVVSRSPTAQAGSIPPAANERQAAEAAPARCACGIDVMSTLSERQQQLLHRAVFEERTTSLLARDECTTSNNIRVQLHRARALLRMRWERRCGLCVSASSAPGCTCTPSRDTGLR